MKLDIELHELADEELQDDLDFEEAFRARPSIFSRRKKKDRKVKKSKKVESQEYVDDIPAVKISKKEKLATYIAEKKANYALKRDIKRIIKEDKKEEKKLNKADKKEKRIEKREIKKQERLEKSQIRKQKRIEKREKRKAKYNNIDKKALIKSGAKLALYTVLTCMCFAGCIVSAAAVTTIGFIPALVASTCLAISSTMWNGFKKEENKEYTKIMNTKVENEKGNSEVKKEGFFKKVKRSFGEKIESSKKVSSKLISRATTTLPPRKEKQPFAAGIKNLNVASDVSNAKLNREDKIARVKEETKLARIKVNNVTSYCVFVAKDDIKLQKFIRSEYRKENPEEKIQSFEMGDNKVLVLNNRPNFK